MARSAREILFGTSTAGPVGDLGLLLLRLFAAFALAYQHGWRKIPPAEGFIERVATFGFPGPPEFWAWMAGFAEFGGAILVAIGLFTRPAAALIVINMIVVVVFGHAGDDFGRRELPLLFLFIFLAFAVLGGGRYSADAALRRDGPRR